MYFLTPETHIHIFMRKIIRKFELKIVITGGWTRTPMCVPCGTKHAMITVKQRKWCLLTTFIEQSKPFGSEWLIDSIRNMQQQQQKRNEIVMIQYCELLTHTNRRNCDVVHIEFYT